MEISRTLLQSIYDNTVGSIGYKTTVGPVDKGKVTKAAAGLPAARPSARLAKAAFDAALTLNPPVPPTPPEPIPVPPRYVKVAPITVREEWGSDQRVCLFTGEVEGGPLRDGVTQLPDGRYSDESGAIYQSNGLEETGIRTKVTDPALVGARSMDGRNACQCPPVGDPTKNTGSWTV
jgi:hypothetical protein